MTINEIKEHLGIDLTIKNRAMEYVILRYIYIEQELKKGNSHYQISKDLKVVHASIYNLERKGFIYKKYYLYETILKSYLEKDKKIFNSIYEMKKQLIKEQNKEYHKAYNRSIAKEIIIKVDIKIKRWSVEKIIQTLRKNNKCRLWNKPMNEFDEKDYEKLNKLLTM